MKRLTYNSIFGGLILWNTIGSASGGIFSRVNNGGERRIRRSLQFGVGVDLGTAPPIAPAPTPPRPAPVPQTSPPQTTPVATNPPTSPPTTIVPEAPLLPGGNASETTNFSYAFQLWVSSEMMLDHSKEIVSNSFKDVVHNLTLEKYPSLTLLNLTTVNTGPCDTNIFKELPFPGYPVCAEMETTVITAAGNGTKTMEAGFEPACLDAIQKFSIVFNQDSTWHQFLAQILYPAPNANGPVPTPAPGDPASPTPSGNNSVQEEKEQTGNDNSSPSIPIWLWIVLAVNVVLTCAICAYCYQRRCMDGKRSRYDDDDDDNSDRSSIYEYEDEEDDFDPNFRQNKNSRRLFSNDESESNGDIFSVLDGPTVTQPTESHGSSFSVLDGYAVEPPENHQRISEDSFSGGEGYVAGDKSARSSSRKARMTKKIRSRKHFAY